MTRADIEARSDPDRRTEKDRVVKEDAMHSMLEEIRADAATRTGAATDAVRILSVEAVMWSDGSLGCPEPGMMYTQALVRGHRIRVDASGTALTYHADMHGRYLQCPPERALEPAPSDPT